MLLIQEMVLAEQAVEYQMLLVVMVHLQVVLDFIQQVAEQEITDAFQLVMLEQVVQVLVLALQAQQVTPLLQVLLNQERQTQVTVVEVLVLAVVTHLIVAQAVKVLLL